MRYGILGPLELSDGGRAIEVTGAKQRALLAMLLLNANRVVSSDGLIDALWEGQAPETAAKALQVHVSQLRKLLGSGRLATRSPGYVLRVDEGELDAHEFEALMRQARDASAVESAELFAQALALWRGQPLADFVFDRFAQAEIARLEELRVEALEDRLDAELALGRHRTLVGELEALVADHPQREKLYGQLMIALYRSGRQAEALDAYQAARRALVEELGIEPGRQLRELHQQVLRQDSLLDFAVAVAPAAETPRGAFVGRDPEFSELVGGLDDVFAGRGRVFLVTGEPGIGKSRLAEELATYARARGAHVLVGRCWEAGGAPAYWPWVQALRAYIREAEPDVLAEQLGAGVADLAQLLPELRELFPRQSAEPLESEGARFRLFDSVTSFVVRVGAARPVALVLDDLHAADEPSLLLLQFVAREIGSSRLLVLGAYRDVDPTVRDPLASTVASLAREPVTQRMALSGLAVPDVAEYIELATGEPPAGNLADAIHAETAGNPLFISEVVRLLATEGGLVARAGARRNIPEGIREVIDRRVGRFSQECRSVLVLAAVLGREFDLGQLAHVSGLGDDDLLSLLEEAAAERVLVDVAGSPGHLRFSHVLIRDALYQELPLPRRVLLHRRVAEALEALYATNAGAHLAELAHHFAEAAPGGDVVRAVDYVRRAADQALFQLAYEEAARLYASALETAELGEGLDDVARADLVLARSDAQTRAGDMPSARESALAAAELARRTGNVEQLARAALGYGGRMIVHAAADDRRLTALLEEALRAVGEADAPLRVRLLARLACALRHQPNRDARAALSTEALDIARRLDEPSTLAYALDGRLGAIWWPENHEERLALAEELVELAEAIGDKERVFFGRGHRMYALLELGQVAAAYEELEARAKIAEDLRQPAELWLVAANRCLRALFEGSFEEAEQLIPEVESLGERVEQRNTLLAVRHQLLLLRRDQGRLSELEAALAPADADPPAPWLLPFFHGELGRAQEAEAVFEELVAAGFEQIPRENEWLFVMCLLAEACGVLGDAQRAAYLYEELLPYDGINVVSAPEVSIGAAARYLGLLAATMLRWDDAERHFIEAIEMNERMGARPWLAHTRHNYARMLLARGAPGDGERANDLHAAVLATYRELGMEGYAASSAALTPTRGPFAR